MPAQNPHSNNNTTTDSAKYKFAEEISTTDSKLRSVGAQTAKTSQVLETQEPLKQEIFTIEELLSKLEFRPPVRVVEFGCGAGNITLALAKMLGAQSEIYGIDIQKDLLLKMLKDAKEQGLNNVKAVWGDLDKIGGSKMADNFFDVAFMVNTLFLLENKQVAFQEAYRILKNTAKLIVVEWKKNKRPIGPPENISIDQNTVLDLAQDAGFMFTELQNLGEYHILYKFLIPQLEINFFYVRS